MNVQVLLLLALAGPLCAFPHTNPTDVTTDPHVGTTQTVAEVVPSISEDSREDHTLATGPPPTEPATAHQEVTKEVVTEATTASVTVSHEEAVVETEAPVAATISTPEALITDPPIEETAAPTVEIVKESFVTRVDEGVGKGVDERVDEGVDGDLKSDTAAETGEEGTEEGLSTGQVVGIVIGSLLAVVIVIAVVIAVVRRMGKYSP